VPPNTPIRLVSARQLVDMDFLDRGGEPLFPDLNARYAEPGRKEKNRT
jgi:hypothetical protein